ISTLIPYTTLFRSGSTYSNTNQTNKAIEAYNELLTNYPQSNLVSKAILRQGLVYFNAKDEDKAIERFKKVVADYPGSQDAIEAVQNARAAYLETGKSNEFATWVQTLDFVDISTAELENDLYSAAENQMLQKNTENALKGFRDYLKTYPNGLHATKSSFNLAEIYFGDNKISEAKEHYENVLKRGKTEY